MAVLPTITELRSMQSADLQKEVAEQQVAITKLRIAVEIGSEKDTAKYRRAKKHLAKLLTILQEKRASAASPPLKETAKTARVSAPVRKKSVQKDDSTPDA